MAALNAGQPAVALQISDLNEERSHSESVELAIFIRDFKLSENKSVVCYQTHVTRPPLGCTFRRSVDVEVVVLGIEHGGGL